MGETQLQEKFIIPERTGKMTEIELRDLADIYSYLTELEARKTTVLQAIGMLNLLSGSI